VKFSKANWKAIRAAVLIAVLTIAFSPTAESAEGNKITLFAAASTTNAFQEIGKLFANDAKCKFVASYASSSTLAKQIERGAPADVYVSANPKWMNHLAKRKAIEPATRFDLLGNRIVLIAPLDSPVKVTIKAGFALAELLGDGRLAMGDPDHVPAGMYGKQALERLGVWRSVESKTARAKDVRAALALVERGEAPLGIVYSTDAAITNRVKVVGVFPEESHEAIVYPVAVVLGHDNALARKFLEFVKTAQARAVFEKFGFKVR
jgi:molybdate transport system substrate-binding protein